MNHTNVRHALGFGCYYMSGVGDDSTSGAVEPG